MHSLIAVQTKWCSYMGRKLPPKLSDEDKKYIRDLLDIEQGPYMPIEDSLRYLYMRYLWQDQIPEYSYPDLGIPFAFAQRITGGMYTVSSSRTNRLV